MTTQSLFENQTVSASIPAPPFRWKTRILLPLVLIVATLVLLTVSAWRTVFAGVGVRVVPVVVKTVDATVGGTGVTASGWLEPDPYPTYVSALTPGVVEEIAVLEGQVITKGQVVARLVTDDARIALSRAQALHGIAKAEVAQASANLEAAREILESLIDRKEAELSAKARIREVDAGLTQLDAQIAADEARLETLVDEHDRKRKLVASGAVSEGEVRRLGLSVTVQRAELHATRERRKVLETQHDRATIERDAAGKHLELRIEERHAIAISEAELSKARAQLLEASARQAEAQLRLDRTVIRSPQDGVVLKRLVSPGSRVLIEGDLHGGHLIHLYEPQRLQVRVDVPLADAAAVGVDQAAEIVIQVLPDQRFSGRISRIVHEADIQKNTVEVKVEISDPDPVLKPEMLARVKLLATASTQESRQRVLAPEKCLRISGTQAQAWVVSHRVAKTGVAELRTVEVGPAAVDGWREVASGLRPGDWLIPNPPAGLESGDRVTIEGEDEE